MTEDQSKFLAELGLSNARSLRLLTAIASELLEQAADRGEFPDRANRIRHEIDQLSGCLRDAESVMEAVRLEFGLT
ncbi:MAG TPA: hypothetical protein VMU04_14125 [Candidatus Acidoferrum sp.]|nr:hypothetical protein [Candidatus Acidoferrum sp.]